MGLECHYPGNAVYGEDGRLPPVRQRHFTVYPGQAGVAVWRGSVLSVGAGDGHGLRMCVRMCVLPCRRVYVHVRVRACVRERLRGKNGGGIVFFCLFFCVCGGGWGAASSVCKLHIL